MPFMHYCKRTYVTIMLMTGLLVSALVLATNFISNCAMLLMDRVNFIPKKSSIFSFSPYKINQGSSSYWLYGEDDENYYHFTYNTSTQYQYISKTNDCPDFERGDITTWCSAANGVTK